MAPLTIKNPFFHSVIFLIATVFSVLNVATGFLDEVDALLRWKATLHSQYGDLLLPSWTDLHHNSSVQRTLSPCSNWLGVSCNDNGSIHGLNLSSCGLNGTLDEFSFSSFPNLKKFELSFNYFSGIIPPDVRYLSNLVYLDFAFNNFSGRIPPEIGELSLLVALHLYNNQLNSSIPQSICQMRLLSSLALSGNHLYGVIPTCLGQLSKLNYIALDNNKFSGPIPYELGNLSDLGWLYMYNNSLTGSIPTTFVNLRNLTVLSLNNNQLNGSIPTEIGKLTSLEMMDLQFNQLSGPIPHSLGELRSLDLLSLYSNQLSGPLPHELGNLTSLSFLELGDNKLNGSIPNSFSNLQNLTYLNLQINHFSGTFPQELETLQLIQIEISNNNFSGNLPDKICNGGKLERLSAVYNNLTGPIPKSLYYCSTLIRLRLDGNQLTGNISESFGVYPNLDFISLNDNKLYGELSNNWSKCKNLTSFAIGGNRISSNIPPSLGSTPKLTFLNLSFNDLVGYIPREFGRMTGLLKLVLTNNQLSGSIPIELGSLAELSYLDISTNKLNGPIPSSIGGCTKLFHLNLSNNEFTHEIPPQIGKLFQLSDLDLSHNLLTAEIPSALSSLTSLESLNLSHNNLSGNIPNSFEKMNALWNIDLSYNELQGPIPNSIGFRNISIEALQGNRGLCGNVTGLKQCASAIPSGAPNQSHKLALMISLPLLGALLLGGLVGVFIFYSQRKRIDNSSTQLVEEDRHCEDFFSISDFDGRDTYHEILKATEGFNEAYCLGKGACGSVYKAQLASGDIVAVKRLHSSSAIVNHDDFVNEIKALTRIRYRNIVKLHGYCAHGQNSFLVYEYLQGGSLADILSNEAAARTLDWMKRMNIIKGVAHALSYMHHDCLPPTVHRDISSKNILLDSEYYEACVSDFGTSKILNQNSSNWSNIAGTFGYLAPEFASTMKVTEKCDVYSFGVLTLEVIKGGHPGDLVTSLTSPSRQKTELKDLMDHRLPVPLPEIKRVLTSILILAIRCVKSNPDIRLTMYDVSLQIEWFISNMSKSDDS